jgi:hypothetical protein
MAWPGRPSLSLAAAVLSLSAPAAEAPDFDRVIAPLLARRCLDCHSGPKPKGGLDLAHRKAAARIVVPGQPEQSTLWQRVRSAGMPPKKSLPAAERQLLQEWIAAGARWGSDPIDPFRFTTPQRAGYDWWALQPVVRPQPPMVRKTDWPRNAVDAFVLARLEAAGLEPAPEADRRTLIRRITFDLTGLPPSPEEVEEFVQDAKPQAAERLVDRLLASPHYGERWARHWLDVVRFGESNGFERDLPRPHAWHYRDWVVRALNEDLPYDEFARLQLAGDFLRPDDPEALKATGFLVAGPHDTVEPVVQRMRDLMRQDEMEDLVGTVGQTFLGLTVNCGRCHDHKFDPISQKDYYRLAAALDGVRHGERDLKLGKVYAVTPAAPVPTHVLLRGEVGANGPLVAPGGIACLPGSADFALKPDAPDRDRRIKLARWISSADNPLFARVIVNRLWHYHFGTGLAETPSDFGFNGARPSHPELLDYLAAELVRQRWSLKALHRTMVLSATYRQSVVANADAARADATNRLLWRRSSQRLEAEAVRDAILAVSGRLDRTVGGKGYQDFRSYFFKGTQFYDPVPQTGPQFTRRTLYRMWARGGRSPFLDTFDCPDPSASSPKRATTTTPLQALALLNNAFILDQADRLADRLRKDAGPEANRQVQRAYQLSFGRAPDAEERDTARSFVSRHGLAAFCRVLFNSNEFLWVE